MDKLKRVFFETNLANYVVVIWVGVTIGYMLAANLTQGKNRMNKSREPESDFWSWLGVIVLVGVYIMASTLEFFSLIP